jgi:hypothetical protein
MEIYTSRGSDVKNPAVPLHLTLGHIECKGMGGSNSPQEAAGLPTEFLISLRRAASVRKGAAMAAKLKHQVSTGWIWGVDHNLGMVP